MTTTVLDGKKRLTILQRSPLDDQAPAPEEAADATQHWVPSRFNVRATADDGRLLLWNTFSTAISAFKPEQLPYVLPLLKAEGVESRREGLVDYLVERGYLVQRGTDEYRKFLLAFGQAHYQTDRLELIVLSSEDCNFRCTYCYEDFAKGTMRPEVRQGIKRLVEQQIARLNMLHVAWFGGEPLYGWDAIAELGPFFSEIAAEHKVFYASNMTTNGYLLTPDVADKLFAWGINTFQITLDGAAEDHDCSRPTRDGRGTFSTIFENLKALARRRDPFRVTLRVNFDNKNHTRIEPFFEVIEREFRGDDRYQLHFHAVGRWGGVNDERLEVCGQDEVQKVSAELKALAHKHGLRVETLKDVNHFGGQVCYAARPFNLIIGATGKVMKCTVVLDKEEHNVVGQLHSDGRLALNADHMALWTEPAFARDHQCQRCVVLPSCQGISCPLPRIKRDERPCVPTRQGAKNQLREALKYPNRAPRTRDVLLAGAPSREG
jgi:uncharacterized protein